MYVLFRNKRYCSKLVMKKLKNWSKEKNSYFQGSVYNEIPASGRFKANAKRSLSFFPYRCRNWIVNFKIARLALVRLSKGTSLCSSISVEFAEYRSALVFRQQCIVDPTFQDDLYGLPHCFKILTAVTL